MTEPDIIPESTLQTPQDIAQLSFEQALQELEAIVRNLETGKVPLDDAINAYERGARLKNRCSELLEQAQTRVEAISLSADGTAKVTDAPLD